MIFHELVFYMSLYLSYILYIIAYLHIGQDNQQYLDILQSFMKYYVTGFLIIRFNPFVKTRFTEFDRMIVFSSAILLLATTAFDNYAKDLDLTELYKLLHFIR